MAVITGTNSLADLAKVQIPILDYGIESIAQSIIEGYNTHNEILNDELNALSESTTEYQSAAPSEANIRRFQAADEFSRVSAQKTENVLPQGFPLYRFQAATGWTADYLQTAPVARIATAAIEILQGDVQQLQNMITTAFFKPTNIATFYDQHEHRFTISNIKALYNADGSSIPQSPQNFTAFDGTTHTHYLASAGGLTSAICLQLLSTVSEHSRASKMILAINLSEEAVMRSLGVFTPLIDARIQSALTLSIGIEALDISRTDNRKIGYLGGAEVWVKSWVPQGYLAAWNSIGMRPFRRREHSMANMRGLRMIASNISQPIQTETSERLIGFGAYSRGQAAVAYLGGSSYVMPTLEAF